MDTLLIRRLLIAFPLLFLCTFSIMDAQAPNQVIRFEIANRRLAGTTYLADVWIMIMPNKVWNVCDSRFGFTFNRNCLDAAPFNYEYLLDFDSGLESQGYTAQQYYYPNIATVVIEIVSPFGNYAIKDGGTNGSSFKLGTVRWQVTDLSGMDGLKFNIPETWVSYYNPAQNACLAYDQVNLSHAGIFPLYVQPTGCVPIYFDQPANCNDPLREYETLNPLSRTCLHWPPAPGPGGQVHRVYYQYDFSQRMPSVARTRDFVENEVPAAFDRARCRWEAQIDQLSPPVTNVFEWAQTTNGARMYFQTNLDLITPDPLQAASYFGLAKSARDPNNQWALVDSANCGTAGYFDKRSEILLNNALFMYQMNPHVKWTTDYQGCGGGPDCLDVYAIVLHEMGHYLGLAHQPRNHEHVMFQSTIWPFITELTQCDADNIRRLYNPSRIGYPIDNSYDCNRFTDVQEHEQATEQFRIVGELEEDYSAVYILSSTGAVELDIYNAIGQRIIPVFHGVQSVGEHTIHLPTQTLAVGVYFIRIKTDTGIETRTLAIIR